MIVNAKSEIPVNSLLTNLMSVGANDAFTYRGYVGPSTNNDTITLYFTLDDLSQSVEISKTDILGHADLPESIMPLGAKIIWVKNSATITRREVSTVRESTAARLPDIREAGRLRMQLRRLLPREGDTCQSRCNTCQSRCRTCHSSSHDRTAAR